MPFKLQKVREKVAKVFMHKVSAHTPSTSVNTDVNSHRTAEASGVGLADSAVNRHASDPTQSSPTQESAAQGLALIPGVKAIVKGRNYGIQVLFEPRPRSKAVVDIVFLHGLTGNAYTTWVHKPTEEHWPSRWLKERISDARIISFGYDADVVNWWRQASTNHVTNHANDMVGGLVRLREETETEDRKIIFVAHSLGGLVVEAALALSKYSPFEYILKIERNTVSVIFLGTPHLGADAAKWATFATRLLSAVRQANVNIVEVLNPDSEMLENIQRNFQSVLRQRIDAQHPIEITCFYEQLPLKVVGEIVPKHSAVLQPYNSYGIHADHMDMTKFSGPGDPGFEAVVGEVLRPVRKIRRTEQLVSIVQTECLQSLFYDSLESRKESVASTDGKSFQWIWTNKSLMFEDWLKEGLGVFWVLGKPGSGKSTLIKHISESSVLKKRLAPAFWQSNSDPIIATHYFDYEDPNPLARNLEGLIRSLLWQILDVNLKAFEAVLTEYLKLKRTRPTVVWKAKTLGRLLHDVLLQHCTAPVCIFIDALDEYREAESTDFQSRYTPLTKYLDSLTSAAPKNVRFFLSSRPYPDFQYDLLTWKNLCHQISIDPLITTDIGIYISTQFDFIVKQDGLQYLQLADQIRKKSSNTFLWVKLVCDKLVYYWKKGEKIARLQKRLADLPDKLMDLYERILSEIEGEERIEVELVLGLVAAARKPLTLIELAYAVNHCYASIEAVYDSMDHMRRRIRAIFGGLLEIRFGRVRFLHETVLHHLRENHDEILASGDIHMLRACISSLSTIFKCSNGEIGGTKKDLLRYAVLNWLEHLQDARVSNCELVNEALATMTNTQFLLWYELFLATSWQLPSIRQRLTYEFSARRLQTLIFVSNLNLALENILPTTLYDISPKEEEQYGAYRSLVEDTTSGLTFLFSVSASESPDGEMMLFFINHSGPTPLNLQEVMGECQIACLENTSTKTVDPFALPQIHVNEAMQRRLRDPELICFKTQARNFAAVNWLNAAAVSMDSQESVSPMQLAAYHGLYGCLEQLFRDEADLNLEAGSVYGTPLLASICGIIELPRPSFERTESVFNCFDFLLFEGADPNQAAFGSNLGGIRTPLELALFALSGRIGAIKSFLRNVNVLEDVPCANLIYVVSQLLDSGALPNLAAQEEFLRYSEIKTLFKARVNDIMVTGKKAYDDSVVQRERTLRALEKFERKPAATPLGSVPIRRYSYGDSYVDSSDTSTRITVNGQLASQETAGLSPQTIRSYK